MQTLIGKKIVLLAVLLAGAVAGALIGAFVAFTRDLPQIQALETFQPQAVTRIYSADRQVLAELYQEKRDPVPLDDIPFYLQAALIATEDRKFYSHPGIDIKGIARAIVKDILAGDFVEGASTITQQLAKTLFLTPRKNIMRKIKEAILAFQLERRYTKDEILGLYLNQVYFGSGAYGVESAAQIFFNKSVRQLSLAECALIAGMPKSPSRFSPLINKDLAIKRRNAVLRQMRATGIISADACDRALAEEITVGEKRRKLTRTPYFTAYVRKYMEDALGAAKLYKGGLSIFTTLDYELQRAAQTAVADGLQALDGRMKQQGTPRASPQAALVALDIRSGAIVAMVGGRDFVQSPFNRVTTAKRQPGSAFKPFVYAHAVEHGFAQNKLILDAPVAFKGSGKGEQWQPHNFSNTFLGEITMRKALAISQNIPAVRLIEMLGPDSVARFAQRFGIAAELTPNLSLALGTSEVTLIELTAAYAVFPRSGKWISPYGVLEALDPQGRVIWRARPEKKLVMTREGAAVITNMLEGVIQEGTGRKARSLQGPLAGKTGTTDNCHDALFIGFSPTIAAGVWVGLDQGGSLGNRETGARAALPIWIDFMKKVPSGGSPRYFDLPDDVVKVRMDPETGLLAADGSETGVEALFKKGTEPRR